MRLLVNKEDDISFQRIINEPKRGIGETTINNAASIADSLGLSFYEVISHAFDYPMLSRAASKLVEFTNLINTLAEALEEKEIQDLTDKYIKEVDAVTARKTKELMEI